MPMGIYIGLLLSFFLLIFSALKNIFIGYALIACWALFAVISLKKGYSLKEIARMSLVGGRQSFVVLRVLILIAAAISTWTGAGTIPAIAYYGLQYATPIMPYTFALAAFLICCLTSFLTGSAFGTVSAVGVPLMIIARSSQANLDLIAGAAIAGAFFGDRCSPMSSSACLVANLTRTDILINVKNMLRTSAIPFLLSLAFYYALSASRPLEAVSSSLTGELAATFNVHPVLLLPAVIMLTLSLCRVSIDVSILFSILGATALAVFYQGHQLTQVISYLLLGFKVNAPGPLQNIIADGGILSMLKTCVVVFVSCSLAGLCSGIKVFGGLKEALSSRRLARHELFGATAAVSVLAGAFGCSQTISVVMTEEIVKDSYRSLDKYQLALDLENSGIMLAALIPWNVACLVPATTMGVAAGFIPYAFFMYVLPITYLVSCRYRRGAASRPWAAGGRGKAGPGATAASDKLTERG
jgi:NhaC family Na+:H+ antiporter